MPQVLADDLFLRNYYTNFPTALKAYKGNYSSLPEGVIVAKTKDAFIRINGGVYELVNGLGREGVYGKLRVNDGVFRSYDIEMQPPTIDLDISELASIDANIEQIVVIKNLYNEEEENQINNKYDKC